MDVVAGRLLGVGRGFGGREITLSLPLMSWPGKHPEFAVDAVAGRLV